MITLKIYIPHPEDATAIGVCSELQFKSAAQPKPESPPPSMSPFRLIRGGKMLDDNAQEDKPYLRVMEHESSAKVLLNYALALIEKAAKVRDGSIRKRDIESAIRRLEVIL